MKISLQKDFLEKVPNFTTAVIFIEHKNDRVDSDGSYQYLYDAIEKCRSKDMDRLNEDFYRRKWSDLWNDLGLRMDQTPPAHLSLLDRIMGAQEIPNINILTNLANATSLTYGMPVGIHDLSFIQNDVLIGLTAADLPFDDRAHGPTLLKSGEPAYFDQDRILTRGLVSKQATTTLVNDGSKRVMVVIDSLGTDTEKLREIAEEFCGSINRFAGDASFKFGIISKTNMELKDNDGETLKSKEVNFTTAAISRDDELIDRILNKAVEDILPSKDELEGLLRSGRRLRIYQGFDPTADTLHIGHTVMMRKLDDFRKLGHEVIMLIGDFTGRIGDPSDKSSARTKLTAEAVANNLKSYREQATAIIQMDDEINPVKVLFNNDWLGKMTFEEVVELSSEFTVQQMLKRDMFQRRMNEDRPIFIHEFLYPLMQGWDAVQMAVDIEIGGNDQLFNMLAGRDLVIKKLHKQKFVIAGKLLTTSDGSKMGKSEGNMIKLSDNARDIFGKVMAFPDEHIVPGLELLTDASLEEVGEFASRLTAGENPIVLKKELALRLTAELKGNNEALEAQRYFEEFYQNQNYDLDITEVSVNAENLTILELLKIFWGTELSGSALRRLIEQGGTKIDNETITDITHVVKITDGIVVRMGKKAIRVKRV